MAKSETSLPQELLDILVCPVDHAKVRLQDEGNKDEGRVGAR